MFNENRPDLQALCSVGSLKVIVYCLILLQLVVKPTIIICFDCEAGLQMHYKHI